MGKNDEYLTGYGEDDVVLSKVYRLLPLAVNLVVSMLMWAIDLHEGDKDSYPAYQDALLDALYMTMITMTTIGYGDLSPSTEVGQYFSTPWMMLTTWLWDKSTTSEKDLTDGLKGMAGDEPQFMWCAANKFMPKEEGMEE